MIDLDVAYVTVPIHICCKRMLQIFHLFRTYATANALCYKCFMSMHAKGAQAKVVSSGAAPPSAREKQSGCNSRRGAQSCIHERGSRRGVRSCIHGWTAGAEHEAASMDR